MTTSRLLDGNGHAPGVTGAMLTVMAACPPAPGQPRPATGWTNGAGLDAQAQLKTARHNVHATTASPLGQVRAMAWLMGIQKPALACCTCSRIASGVASRRSFYDAVQWLTKAGFAPDDAAHVAGLVWPVEVPGGGGAGEGAVVTRVGPRRRPEDVGSGAAGTTPV